MNYRTFSGLLLLIGLLFNCQPTEKADTIYINAQIWTGDASHPNAKCLGIKAGKILFVENGYHSWVGSETEMVDLEGKMIVPGFIDNHTHFISGGFYLGGVDLRPAQNPQDFSGRLKDFAASHPKGRWITGGDWDHEAWGGELPHRDWIDSFTEEHPVFVSRLDGHMALANSLVLKMANITKDTPDPEGGTIIKDPVTGEPTGVLKDEAMSLVYAIMPPASEKELDEALDRGISHALSLGITQIHDVGSEGGWIDLATFRRAKAEDRLHLRVYSMVPLSTWPRLIEFIDENGKGDDHLRWGALKGFVDGSLGSTTAWFYDHYLDEPETSGLLINDTTVLHDLILEADEAGLHLAVHAIGDRANDFLLGIFEEAIQKNGPRDRRFRIEHAQHLSKEGIQKFNQLGVIPSMQPYHAIDDGRWAEKRIGPDRIKTTYAFRSILNAEARLTFGSDWTVAPINPLEGIYAAVTRQTLDGKNPEGWVPEEKISVEEALRCYTINNAYAGFQEENLGILKEGYLADFVVLSENLLEIGPEKIKKVKILRTIVGGKEVFPRQ